MCTLKQMVQLAKSYKKWLLGGNQKIPFCHNVPKLFYKEDSIGHAKVCKILIYILAKKLQG